MEVMIFMGKWKKPKTRKRSKPVVSIIDRELEMLYALSKTSNDNNEQKVIQEKIEILKK